MTIHDVRTETRWFTTKSYSTWHVLAPGDHALCRANIRPYIATLSDAQRDAYPLPIPRCSACVRKLATPVAAPVRKPSYVTVRDAHLPATIDGWNGQTYSKREVAAMNVQPGDRIVFWDMTGDTALYGIARVVSADYDKDAHPWERITLWLGEWRGADGIACELKSWMRPGKLYCGTRARVTVWRTTGA